MGRNQRFQNSRGYEDFEGVIGEASSQSTPWWPPQVRPNEGAPNVIIVLMDDMGFSDIAPFGSEIDTPHLTELADDGYRFTNYRTPPVCSPARAALLTGLNPHRAGFASTAHGDPGYPGHRYEIAPDVPTIAESFRAVGYATFMVGKWHLTKDSLLHDGADKSSWPVQRGFDRYFGSMEGFTTLFQPHRLLRDNSPVTVDHQSHEEYLTDSLTDEAVGMIASLRASDPHKPFFLYFAHHAVHGPIQAKPEDIAKYRGQYECGWDHIRSERFRRQIREGVFPESTIPAPRNTEPGLDVPPWDSLSDEQRHRFARYMEVYAAAIDNVDQNFGRLVEHLKEIGEYDNTIIVFTSDNGGTAEGGPDGTRSYFSQFVWNVDLPSDWVSDVDRDIDLIGGPQSMAHYPRGWAYASNTPFRLYKTHTFEGGIHAPLIVSWPQGLPKEENDSGIRHQFVYVTDVGQTVLDLANVPRLAERAGRSAPSVDGVSFTPALRSATHPPTRREQYSEFAGNRAYICDNWKITTEHVRGRSYSDSEWQLFDIDTDPTETKNLAAEHPDIVTKLAKKWHDAAWRNAVFPLNDDGTVHGTVRPGEDFMDQPVTLYPGTPTLERHRSSRLITGRSFEILARLAYRSSDRGVIVAHGDQGGGYALSIDEGDLVLAYNEYGVMHRARSPLEGDGTYIIRVCAEVLPELRWAFTVDVNGTSVSRLGPVAQLTSMAPFTGVSVGIDRGSPVDWDNYAKHGPDRYSGSLRSLRYVPGPVGGTRQDLVDAIARETDRIYD